MSLVTARAAWLGAAVAALAGLATPARAADPCIQFNISGVSSDGGMEFASGSSKFTLVRQAMEPNLQRIRTETARIFGQAKLAIAFECPPGRTQIIGKANGRVVADKKFGEQFRGQFYFVGPPWARAIKNQWELVFSIDEADCDISDEFLAISSALVDHLKNNGGRLSVQALAELDGYVDRSCGIRGSASFRQFRARVELLTS